MHYVLVRGPLLKNVRSAKWLMASETWRKMGRTVVQKKRNFGVGDPLTSLGSTKENVRRWRTITMAVHV
jgi:hypothetical protein